MTGFETTTTTSSDYDLMADGPSQNFATLNPLTSDSNHSLHPTCRIQRSPDTKPACCHHHQRHRRFPSCPRTRQQHLSVAQADSKNPDGYTGFQAAMWWIKDISIQINMAIIDSVRGPNNALTCPAKGSSDCLVTPPWHINLLLLARRSSIWI
jgi:hypothetical protein